jgi:hypothetical protein
MEQKNQKRWKNAQASWWEKIRDIAIEIIVVVIGVSTSIWLNNINTAQHDRQNAKDFMRGLKTDLMIDLKELESDRIAYGEKEAAFKYLSALKIKEVPNADSLKKYDQYLKNSIQFMPNSSRFEGFKSAGRIETIQNKELQNDILNLYQETIPILLASTVPYSVIQKDLTTFVMKNQRRLTDSTSNFKQIIVMEEAHNLCQRLTFVSEITRRYDACIIKIQSIIARINQEIALDN